MTDEDAELFEDSEPKPKQVKNRKTGKLETKYSNPRYVRSLYGATVQGMIFCETCGAEVGGVQHAGRGGGVVIRGTGLKMLASWLIRTYCGFRISRGNDAGLTKGRRAMATKKKGTKAVNPLAKKAAASRKAAAARKAKKGGVTPLLKPKDQKKAAKAGKAKPEPKAKAEKRQLVAPQFFGRPKGAKKIVDPVAQKEQRAADHAAMMAKPWYAEHRKTSIALWVERRKAIAAGDDDAVQRINRKLEAATKKMQKARAEDGGKPLKAGKPAKKAAAPKKAGKPKKTKKQAEAQPEPQTVDADRADEVNAIVEEAGTLLGIDDAAAEAE